jgi:hypothetical protein
MARPTTLPTPPTEVTLPKAASDHLPQVALDNLPDFIAVDETADVTFPDSALPLPDHANVPDWLLI